MAGLVPVIPIEEPRHCHYNRDHRDKPGDDEAETLLQWLRQRVPYSPMAIKFALPPAAAVLIVTVCSLAKRRR